MMNNNISIPRAPHHDSRRSFHNDTFIDHYEWLRDNHSQETQDFISDENAYTKRRMAPLTGLRQTLFTEFIHHVQQTDLSVPTRMDGWWYFTRTVEGQQYGIHCRIPVTDQNDWNPPIIHVSDQPGSQPGEQVYFDTNKESEGHDFFSLGALEISKDGSLLMYSTDTHGDERYDIHLRVIGANNHYQCAPGTDLSDYIPQVASGGCLTPDAQWIFYTKVDQAWRPWSVWRHRIGTPVDDDVEVWSDPDERFFVGVGMSFDEKSIIITSASKTTTEVLWLAASDPTGTFQPVIPRQDGIDYDVSLAHLEDHSTGTLENIPLIVIIHNNNNPNFEIDIIDARQQQPPYHIGDGKCIARGSTLLDDPHIRVGQRIEGIEFYRNYIVLSYRRHGLPRLAALTTHQAIQNFKNNEPWEFQEIIPQQGLMGKANLDPYDHGTELNEKDDESRLWSIGSLGSPSYEAPYLRYAYTSYTVPGEVHEIHLESGHDVVLKKATVLGDFNADDYCEKRVWAEARDGIKIPISLVWKKDALKTPAPLFITGYGAYEASLDPSFSVGRLSLLNRGVLYAVAHVRGGGEMGRQWYEQGKELLKKNTFTDFIDCTQWIEDHGLADAQRTVANGGSAGGLLMGAITNMAPQLYHGIEADVPFVDALTSILDPSLPLTVTEWDEWGDPLHDPKIYDYMKSYSPYENVQNADERLQRFGTAAMPNIFITTSLNDTRVLPVEPLKWVARLQEPEVCADAIIKIETDPAGHGGISGRYSQWKELAYENAWCLWMMGITQ